MSPNRSRRGFLANVGRGTLLATLGPVIAEDLGLVPRAFADDHNEQLTFGALEPLVCRLQETPAERLQRFLVKEMNGGVSLTTLVSAAALANARTFGGEDYIGFHTFMALSPALQMSSLMPTGSAALPVLKVLYRNSARIQDYGGRSSEVLHSLPQSLRSESTVPANLHEAIFARDTRRAEEVLSAMMSSDPQSALDALLPAVQDSPEVHKTVLPYRAWEMQSILGTEHALTLLRQSLRYCLRVEPGERKEWDRQGTMLARMLDEYNLNGREPGNKPADDAFLEHLTQTFDTATPEDAASAAASALSDGMAPSVIGEAMSLAASRIVLLDRGRLPQWEDRLKPAGCVHGDSAGVHASDAANAWRHLATAGSGRNVFACLIIGAWQVARDRGEPGNMLEKPLPAAHQLDRITAKDADRLLSQLNEAIQHNLQGQATAIVHRYGQLSLPEDRLFATLLKYAVSEDGALHAEKYFHTVHDDFRLTRPSARWQHVAALARVTASEFGFPAAGQAEARELLGV